MLPKRQRLTHAGVMSVLAVGRRVRGVHLTLVVAPAPHFQSGIVVGKKVAARAVARNALRRRLYALMRRYTGSMHIVVLTYPRCAELPPDALERELTDLLARVPER